MPALLASTQCGGSDGECRHTHCVCLHYWPVHSVVGAACTHCVYLHYRPVHSVVGAACTHCVCLHYLSVHSVVGAACTHCVCLHYLPVHSVVGAACRTFRTQFLGGLHLSRTSHIAHGDFQEQGFFVFFLSFQFPCLSQICSLSGWGTGAWLHHFQRKQPPSRQML